MRIFRKLAQLLDVDLASTPPGDGDALVFDSGTEKWIPGAGGGGGGAPTDVNYLVGTADSGLSAEIVVGTTPGGELGGTWASPTVDATHSGSSHASVQAAAEATAAGELATHSADTTGVHGISDTSALALTANVPSNATFNDHSARHENGGADEISIAGLDGTSTELAAHIADSSAAHAASAISVSSTTLSGTGTDVQAVFEEIDNLLDDHSSRHEDGGADEISIQGLSGTPAALTTHEADTTSVHGITDTSALALTADVITKAFIAAKGDLITATANDTPAILTVGTDGHVLTADSGQSTGVKWAAASSGALTRLYDSTLGSDTANFDITSISGSYTDLIVRMLLRCTDSGNTTRDIHLTVNNDTGGNYDHIRHYRLSGTEGESHANGDTKIVLGSAVSDNATTGRVAVVELTIPCYAQTTFMKIMEARGAPVWGTGDADKSTTQITALWRSTSAITRLTITPQNNNWKTGSRVTVWGRL